MTSKMIKFSLQFSSTKFLLAFQAVSAAGVHETRQNDKKIEEKFYGRESCKNTNGL